MNEQQRLDGLIETAVDAFVAGKSPEPRLPQRERETLMKLSRCLYDLQEPFLPIAEFKVNAMVIPLESAVNILEALKHCQSMLAEIGVPVCDMPREPARKKPKGGTE